MLNMAGFDFMLFLPLGAFIALVFAAYLIKRILRFSQGSQRMIEIASAVKLGARAYLKRQNSTVALFLLATSLILAYLALRGYLVIFVPLAFLSGGFFSGLAGFIGMLVATSSSSRTANAARQSLNSGLRVAFSSGAVMGLVVVGFGLLHLGFWYFLLDWYYSQYALPANMDKITAITSTLLCSGMGASFVALFARVGGGIFTKAADVGADLVGKVEAGIPEDDPRNPAVIADNVGDNVGDVAGMGADLYESYIGSIVATAALGVAGGFGMGGVGLPFMIAAFGVVASIIGTFFVRSSEEAKQANLLAALRRGTLISSFLVALCAYFIVRWLIREGSLGVYLSMLLGLFAGMFIGFSTEIFTSSNFKATRSVAGAAASGPATVIIEGMAAGMLSTAFPVLAVGGVVLGSFFLSGGAANFNAGLYGVGISAVGMLSTLGITLASDAYGPVADNAGGNAEMAGLGPEVRRKTDALDALGNTTAATGKGFAIGSAALTALALIAAYRQQIVLLGAQLNLSLLNPNVLVGLFIGAMLPFLFSSMTIRAVGRAASAIITEVRRQFKEIPGIMESKVKPDYALCVGIVTRAAQKEMILPSLTAIIAPILAGILIGAEAVVGLLAGATVSGFALAIMMANAGGSWDNAKKYIEEGNLGGKGSAAHKAAVVGDTVGDPFKDTSGPSLNILIKLMSMVSIVFAAFILTYSLF